MQTYATRTPPAHASAYEADSLRVTLRGIFRSWWIILIAAAVAVGAAIAYSTTRPTTYQATASLLFNDAAYQQAVSGGGYSPVDAQRRLRTSADVLRLPAVAEQATRKLQGQPGYHPVGASVKTQFSLDSNTMRIVATARDRRSPALLANATADAFLAYRRDMSASSLNEARSVLREQIANAPTKTERRALVAKRNNLDAMKALDDQDIQIAQRAAAPTAAANQDTRRNALIALVLGVLVGIAISLFRIREPAPPLHDPWADAEVEPSAGRS